MIIAILILILIIIAIVKSKIRFNLPHGALLLIDGAVKVGKTKCAVTMAIRDYRKALLRYKIGKYILQKKVERPMLYSNIPLNVKDGYVKITQEVLMRKERVTERSVVLLSEASLVADNNLYKDREATINIMLFCKLFGHESKGGTLIIETQAIGDLAVQIRRCIANKWYIDHATKIPILGFSILHVRNERYSEDGNNVNTYTEEQKFDRLFVPNRVHKIYDSYCYSYFTDNLKAATKRTIPTTLKAIDIVSFSKDVIKGLNKEQENEENKHNNR